MRLIRFVLVVLAAAGAVVLLAGPLAAQTPTTDSTRSFIVLTGQIDIAEGQVYEDAVIFDGDATIAGAVVNDAVAFNGDVTVSGDIGGSVVALNGKVTLESGATVGGDVVSSEPAAIAEGATVTGTTSSSGLPTNFNVGKFVTVSRVAVWVATSVSSFLLGLLLLLFAPRAGEAVATTASTMFGRSVGIGFAVFFGLPIAALIALITLVGIPFGAGLLLGLALLFWIGYVAAAIAIGRLLVKPPTSRLLAFLAGWLILRVVAIIPGIGGLVWFLATVFGLGAIAVAARRAGRIETPAAGSGAIAVPPPPPMPPAVPSAP
jgi:cytoskeletal protein CcmA (bactofilin family)